MEQQKLDNYVTLSTAGNLPVSHMNSPPPPPLVAAKKKRRRGAMHVIKVALLMLRLRSADKAKSVDVVASRGIWSRLVGSIRPLHLQNGSPRHSSTINSNNNSIIIQEKRNDDVINNIASMTVQQPMSPAASSSSSGSEDGTSRYASAGNLQELESRYASAVNLQDLNPSSKEEDEEEGEYGYEYDENGGDEMIDAKAEEFIAQFYEQMRLQRLNSVERRYKEMIERSIS